MNYANILCYLRMFLSIPIFIFTIMAYQNNDLYLLALIFFLLASLTDLFDGYIARKTNKVTDYGKFLDQISDKILVNVVLIALLSQNLIPAWFVAVVISRDTIISGIRMLLAKNNFVLAADIWGKIKTTFQMFLILYIYLENYLILSNLLTYLLLIITAISTVISAINYINKSIKLFYKNMEG